MTDQDILKIQSKVIYKNHRYPAVSSKLRKLRLTDNEYRSLSHFVLGRLQNDSTGLIAFEKGMDWIENKRKRTDKNGSKKD